ncbi:MAG: hypothetical protein RL410_289 [Actinomycetota bacterium]|jgi:gamma-glutamylcyclotransferase (GGCT)/AIG2-like uncharacterized protein YtfP
MGIYAAYGSNLDPARMALRAPHSPAIGAGWLNGWRLTFGGEDLSWEGPLPTLVEDSISQVFVMLYALTDEDEAALDNAEGFDIGFYRKMRIRVSTLDGETQAWMYVVDGYEDGVPKYEHLHTIIEAAIVAGAPNDYIESLRSRAYREED